MKRPFSILLLFILLLTLSACGGQLRENDTDTLTVAVSTYPIYLFTTAIAQDADNVQVELIVNEPTSCLHDYTLTIQDMKVIEEADVLILNGAGLEAFMKDALAHSTAQVISCDRGISLLTAEGHDHEHEHDHGHSHDHEDDPHFWLSPRCAAQMLSTIAEGLSAANPTNSKYYTQNLVAALEELSQLESHQAEVVALDHTEFITFHDGFRYFARDCDLHLLRSIEEEEGSEASAAELVEIVKLIREHRVAAIFTEVNGSGSAAGTIARETGVAVGSLNMIMSGTGSGMRPYLDAMHTNYDTILAVLGG